MNMYYRTMIGHKVDGTDLQMDSAVASGQTCRFYKKTGSIYMDSVYDSTPLGTVLSSVLGSLLASGQKRISELVILGVRFGF